MDKNKTPNEKVASTKAAKILKSLDKKELEHVSGAACLTCGLLTRPGLSIVIGS
jgi:hypothetical protein